MSTDDKLLQELKEATDAQLNQEEKKEEVNTTAPETPSESDEVESKEEKEYNELEQEQIKEGWDPTGSKTAEQFKHDGSFFRKIKELKKENQEIRDAFRNMTSHQKKLEKAAYVRALEDIKAERDAAVEVGDVDLVNALEQRRDNTKAHLEVIEKEEKIVTEVQRNEPIPAALEFKDRNADWFRTELLTQDVKTLKGKDLQDYKMTQKALTYDDYLGLKIEKGLLNYTPEESIKLVEEFIKEEYPDRFSPKENPNREAAPATGKSTTSSSGNSDLKLVGRMSEQQKSAFNMYQKACPGLYKSIEEYAKQLQEIGDLKN